MEKPDFGIGKLYTIKWTAPRIAYLRHLAAQRMSATEIAIDIGLDVNSSKRITEACRKHGIKLRGRPGRRAHRPHPILIEIPEGSIPVLDRLGAKHGMSKADVARALLAAIFAESEIFLDNLLDLGGAGD
jgi:hypothetical protein